MTATNIFIPRNDWNVKAFLCKRAVPFDLFEKLVARVVQNETGINPLNYRHYRGAKLVQARQLFMVMMVLYTKRTYSSIAGIVGKDHATINHCIKAVNNMNDTDKLFRAMYNRINELVKQISIS